MYGAALERACLTCERFTGDSKGIGRSIPTTVPLGCWRRQNSKPFLEVSLKYVEGMEPPIWQNIAQELQAMDTTFAFGKVAERSQKTPERSTEKGGYIHRSVSLRGAQSSFRKRGPTGACLEDEAASRMRT